MAGHPSHVYARQLLPMRYGYPLYYPEPLDNLPVELRERGTGIGDVGIIMRDGLFQFAFNIFTPGTDTAINCFGVPDGFHNMALGHISRLPGKHGKPSELASANDRSNPPAAGVPIGYSVVSSSSESAQLTMPDGAMGEDYTSIHEIRTYSIEHALSWYEFINDRLGRQAPNGSLYVVTGCDRSTTWGISTIGEELSVESGAGYSCSWSTRSGAIVRRSTAWCPDEGAEQPENRVESPQNQCLFIRGFKIRVRERLSDAPMDPTAVEPSTDHADIEKLMRQHEKLFPDSEGAESGSSELGAYSQPGDGASQWEGVDDWIDDVLDFDPFVGPYHPLDSINKYLLETTPQAQIAISHESDWWVLSPGATLANEDEIIGRLGGHFTPSILGGGVFLAKREPALAQTDDGTAMDEDHEPAIPSAQGPLDSYDHPQQG
ncbi:hypothetical protein FIBSPDRAFT_858946 [Athelia psychrophila]|uniref:Uncharacterized protein n=1 Tax=Athelia psychrophila TaxID=1759441 RepID=A0A166LJ07_9AGAM|nr:hypothetical protein FIBSPDRAFT_858946 [Fibularhizoctonia sp. CBS 109695]